MYRRKKDRSKIKSIIRYVLICTILFIVGVFVGKTIVTKSNKVDKTVLVTNNIQNEDTDSSKYEEQISEDNNVSQERDMPSDGKRIKDMLRSGNYKSKEKKIAYLTFDDGPSVTVTPRVLDILKEQNIKGTFFVVGRELDNSEQAKHLLQRIVDEGNTLANHTYSHDYKKLYPGGKVDTIAFMGELEKTNEIIKNVVGEKNIPRIIRFPGGHGSWKGTEEMDKLLDEKGYIYIDWNCLVGDAEGKPRNREGLITRFNETKIQNAGNGDLVVLMHDTYGKEETANVLTEIINQLKNEGYEFHTLI